MNAATPRDSARKHSEERLRKLRAYEQGLEFLPSPEVLEAYSQVLEGSAETILKLIEDEQRHRHYLEQKALTIQQFGMAFGQFMGAMLGGMVVVGTVVLGLNGQTELGTLMSVTGLSALTLAYVKGRRAMQHVPKKRAVTPPPAPEEDNTSSPSTVRPALPRPGHGSRTVRPDADFPL
jgi:uncharacterized membrane protein